ncbi:tripartite tricarboxylate transporter TctB family protein [Pigmentiphaga sp.]|uniref:tripartite tricarboxylate transporter TctB family protein n=1 Tax=Pigmentiphaga sp. TaxID=1977564 RepID=UPI0025DA8971|nr:tripartite tricarboxylate transporter TctB family protein [Pigmentiphaga sp.]
MSLPLRARSPQDVAAGVLLLGICLAGIHFGRDLEAGTAADMGPGYFPMVLSGIIGVCGLTLLARGVSRDGPAIDTVRLRPVLCVLGALLAFFIMIDRAGLVPSVVAMTFIAAYARPRARFAETLVLAIVVAVFAVLVFIEALHLPMQIWWGAQ